jgi:hypothetical protein
VRRTVFQTGVLVLAAACALLGAAAPAGATIGAARATEARDHNPWVPLPSAPFDLAAGDYCAFPVHGDPIVDRVRVKTIARYPDGSPKRQLATGALMFRMTNTATGASTIADAGGSAIFELFPDGSRTWHVIGPVLAAFKDGAANIPRGVWTINGLYDVHFSPTGFKTVTLFHGSVHDVCADLD